MKAWELLKKENVDKEFMDVETKEVFKVVAVGEDNYKLESVSGLKLDLTSKVLNKEFVLYVKLNGWERVERNSEYRGISTSSIIKSKELNDLHDMTMYRIANYFSTDEKASEVNKEQTLYRLMRRFRDMNDDKIDWNNEIIGYHINWNREDKRYEVLNSLRYRTLNTIYFNKYSLAKRCINEVVIPFLETESEKNTENM